MLAAAGEIPDPELILDAEASIDVAQRPSKTPQAKSERSTQGKRTRRIVRWTLKAKFANGTAP